MDGAAVPESRLQYSPGKGGGRDGASGFLFHFGSLYAAAGAALSLSGTAVPRAVRKYYPGEGAASPYLLFITFAVDRDFFVLERSLSICANYSEYTNGDVKGSSVKYA